MVNHAELVGVPFAYGGRGPDSYDCYGLVLECARRDGITLPDFGFADNQARISAMMGATLPQWHETAAAPGVVALLRVGRWVSHVGYLLDENRMIHTWSESGGVTIERLDIWKHRIVGLYKHVGN
jgi:cell wall-associated NlpC family hydrolase